MREKRDTKYLISKIAERKKRDKLIERQRHIYYTNSMVLAEKLSDKAGVLIIFNQKRGTKY